ncbi:hypothetical protein CDAR_574651 [Caerostris darwini]|uniref:Uncharacterized protein n=1 Tax=Caerostris darwini TaxID=1538125 RepID=A0AAV4QIU6_9ARAC|nr:hypothetical protein CDAR_574651 [Caerostris darwini]
MNREAMSFVMWQQHFYRLTTITTTQETLKPHQGTISRGVIESERAAFGTGLMFYVVIGNVGTISYPWNICHYLNGGFAFRKVGY